ncbi:unnamed protein product [Camellia sinensis]
MVRAAQNFNLEQSSPFSGETGLAVATIDGSILEVCSDSPSLSLSLSLAFTPFFNFLFKIPKHATCFPPLSLSLSIFFPFQSVSPQVLVGVERESEQRRPGYRRGRLHTNFARVHYFKIK